MYDSRLQKSPTTNQLVSPGGQALVPPSAPPNQHVEGLLAQLEQDIIVGVKHLSRVEADRRAEYNAD